MTPIDIETWLRSTLSGDATLTGLVPASRIFSHVAPAGTVRPFITYQPQSYTEESDLCGQVAAGRAIYQVRVTGDTTPLDLQAAARINELLAGASDEQGDTVVRGSRLSPILFTEAPGSERIVHCGGLYLIEYSPIS